MDIKLTIICLLLVLAITWPMGPRAVGNDSDDFPRQIAPLLVKRCLACHNPKKLEGNYSLASLQDMFRAGDSGRSSIVPGNPAASELYQRLIHADPSVRMPSDAEPLEPHQIELISKWIASLKSDSVLDTRPLEQYANHGVGPVLAPARYSKRLPITSIALASGGDRIFASGYGEVTVWDSVTGQLARRIHVGWPHIADIEVTRDGGLIAVSAGTPGQFGTVLLINLSSSDSPAILINGSDLFPDTVFSPDESRLCVGGYDGSMRVFDCSTGKVLHQSTPHADCINALAWSSQGNHILTASRDRTAKFFRAETFELIASFDRHERTVGGVAILDSRPASVDETGKLRIWPDDGTDRELTERTGLARSAQRIFANPVHLLVPDRHLIRLYSVSQKAEDAGKDEQGKQKTKTKITLVDGPALEIPVGARIMSLCALGSDIVAAGTDKGEIHVWTSGRGRPIRSFTANP